jgi:hypothetical protein
MGNGGVVPSSLVWELDGSERLLIKLKAHVQNMKGGGNQIYIFVLSPKRCETTMQIRHSSEKTNEARARGSVVVKALCYKPEGRRFNTR